MRVLLGLSGGVDSAIAAYILKKSGYEVIGITFKLSDDDSIIKDAEIVAKSLNIEWNWFDYSSYFKKKIVNYFFKSYANAKTPSPCLFCNRDVKFKLMYEKLKEMGCDLVATGHYAKISNIDGTKVVAKSRSAKDQSYFLALVSSNYLKKTIFPLGEIKNKENVRKTASDLKLPIAKKRESFDICFIQGDYREQMKKQYKNKDGYFILNGKKIKKHEGIFNYTVGQRKGLRIPYKEALYVKKIDPNSSSIYLATRNEMFVSNIEAKLINILYVPSNRFEAKAKLRSKMKEEKCLVEIKRDKIFIEFDQPQFAPTPGQIAAIYYKDAIIMAGVIL